MNSLEKTNKDYQTQLNDWIKQEKAAIDLINAVGKLWFEKSIELILFRNQFIIYIIMQRHAFLDHGRQN